MPDVLQRTQPAVTKHIRTLSKRILPWMEEACSALPPQSRAQKIRDTALFAQVTGPSCAKSLFVPCLNPLHAVTMRFLIVSATAATSPLLWAEPFGRCCKRPFGKGASGCGSEFFITSRVFLLLLLCFVCVVALSCLLSRVAVCVRGCVSVCVRLSVCLCACVRGRCEKTLRRLTLTPSLMRSCG